MTVCASMSIMQWRHITSPSDSGWSGMDSQSISLRSTFFELRR